MSISIRMIPLFVALLVCAGPLELARAQEQFPIFEFGGAAEPAGDLELAATLKSVDASTVELSVIVTLPEDYYIYSMDPSFDGKAEISLKLPNGVEPSGDWSADRKPKVVDDPFLNQTVEKFIGGVTWTRQFKSKSGAIPEGLTISGALSGQFCSTGESGTCVPLNPPREFSAKLSGNVSAPGDVPTPVRETPVTSEPGTSEPGSEAPPSQTSSENSSASSQSSMTIRPKSGDEDAPIEYQISLISSSSDSPTSQGEVTLSIKAMVEKPWHTFALDQDPDMSGEPTKIEVTKLIGMKELDSEFMPSVQPMIEKPTSDIVQRVHYGQIEWTRRYKATSTKVGVEGTILFQLCNEGSCIPPSEVTFAVGTGVAPDRSVAEAPAPAANEAAGADDNAVEAGAPGGDGLVPFVLSAIAAGFVALLTPCVFPMVPVTVAFFLKQSEKKTGSSIGLAVVYCLGIIGTFTVLGLLVAVIFGPTKLNEIANDRWLNLGFSGLFFVFSLMLLGMFELRMPSWLLTWSSRRESSGGVVGALFMALTFTLVSFTCTFAFVGSLLVWAAKGDRLWPIIGMLAFSAAFASPFFFLALFPALLKKLPRSGGWMNTVKVTMGLIELALVLKFLSVADIGFSPDHLPWIVDRASFLTGWVAIAAITGLYLLGTFRMSNDTPTDGISAIRCCFAIFFLSLAAYVGSGVYSPQPPKGWLWQQIASFAPPDAPTHMIDFREAVRVASRTNKPLFIDFTGVNCVNCRKMEQTVLIRPEVTDVLKQTVQVQLFTDRIPGVTDSRTHETLLAINRKLQTDWFKDVTLPGYAIVSPDGKVVFAGFKGYDPSRGENFLKFVKAGLASWKKSQEPRTAGK